MELDTPTLCEAISCGDTETVSSILTDCPPDALDAPDNVGVFTLDALQAGLLPVRRHITLCMASAGFRIIHS